jgi:hypothetical protein
MLVETPLRLVRLRPHHISGFARHWLCGNFLPPVLAELNGYTPRSVRRIKKLFGDVIEDRGNIGVVVVNGSDGDSVCDNCNKKKKCESRTMPDSRRAWIGSRRITGESGFKFGKVYPSEEFRSIVRRLSLV